MKIYLDINDFEHDSTVMSTLRSYNSIDGNLEIYVKANGATYSELDDFKKVRRRNKFDEDDLKKINFFIKTFHSFEDFKLENDEDVAFRIHDDTLENEKRINMLYKLDEDHELLKEKIEKVTNFYKNYLLKKGVSPSINLGIVEKYNYKSDKTYDFIKNNIDIFNEIVPLKKVIDHSNNILLLDEEVRFYIFTLLSYYSKFKKKEKSVKSYFATFKPFGYHKEVETEVNLESLFTYSTFVIDKNNKVTLYVAKDIEPSELFSLLTFLQRLNNYEIEG